MLPLPEGETAVLSRYGPFATSTVTALEVVFCPRLSVAIAVSAWGPLELTEVDQDVEKVGPPPVSTEPRFAPSSWNCNEATPATAVAFAVTLIFPDTLPPVGAVMLTD